MQGSFGSSWKWVLFWVLASASAASAQQQSQVLSCQANVNPILVRGEGLTERMGDIVFTCTGGVPSTTYTGNLSIFLSVSLTNRVDVNGNTDLMLSADNGSGAIPIYSQARYLNSGTLSFSGVSFTLSPSGSVILKLSNLRGAAFQTGVNSLRQITASLSFNGGGLLSFSTNIFPVGTVVQSLLSSYTSTLICSGVGTPSIDTLTMSNALAIGAVYSSVRVTEGYNSSFAPRTDINFQDADHGSRILLRFSGIPAGVRMFAPDAVVGYDGFTPTSAGDYGLTPAGGTYGPGRGQLLFVRMNNADAYGGGANAVPAIIPPSLSHSYVATFDSLGEIPVAADGTAQAVYEVYDANPLTVESATFPTFIYVPPGAVQVFTNIHQDVALAATSPASNLSTSPAADVPRFVPVTPPNDCTAVGDCSAPYFPKLGVNTNHFSISMTTLDGTKTQYLVISNAGGGNYLWKATVNYLNGSIGNYQWLRLGETAGINRETLSLAYVPGTLPPGAYDALVTIDGGIAGKQLIQVTMYLSYQAPTPVLINAINPANQVPGNLVPGSLAEILGDRLEGNVINVLFNTSPAQVVQVLSPQKLVVQVPYEMAGQDTALITVNVDGSTGDGILMPIVSSAPGVYANSIINSDNTKNTPSNGAVTGTVVTLYATGLPSQGVYSGQIHDRMITGDSLIYAGPAPGAIGIQQVQMIVPPDLPSMTTSITVCGGPTADTQVCSGSVDVTLLALPQVAKPVQ